MPPDLVVSCFSLFSASAQPSAQTLWIARFFDQSVLKRFTESARSAALLGRNELGTGMSISVGSQQLHIQSEICSRVWGADAAQLNLFGRTIVKKSRLIVGFFVSLDLVCLQLDWNRQRGLFVLVRYLDRSSEQRSKVLAWPAAQLGRREQVCRSAQGDCNHTSEARSVHGYSAAVSRLTGGSFSLAFQTTSSGVPMTRG